MKFLKGLLYGFLGLLSLVSLFIIICAFWPGLSDKASDFLYERMGNRYSPEEGMALAQEDMLPEAGENHEAANTGADSGGESKDSIGYVMETDPASGYVPPEKTDIDAPESVAGRGGYVPVQEVAEQIDEEEARKLQEQYTYGETGEGLSFDTEFYPYYGMLPEKGQSLYRQIYANAMAVNGIFNPVVPVSQGELRNIFMAVFNDHPELFWLDSAYRAKFARNGECAEIALQFNYLVDDLDTAKNEFSQASEEILAGARNQGSDYDKEVYVHNMLLGKIEYDLGASLNQSAYSALVNGRSVCAGYARSLQYLMTELGVPCYYCTGYAGENHAWNILCLDGEYYNADATWDDTDPNTYDYFNKTDNEFASTHRREDLSVYLPACNGTKYSNLEEAPEGEGNGGRSLEEAGFSQEDVLSSMQDYYGDCYQRLMAAGGSCQFDNLVESEELWMQCYRAYENGGYSAGYMDQVLEELQAGGCEVDIEAESLRDGRVLLHHSITFYE